MKILILFLLLYSSGLFCFLFGTATAGETWSSKPNSIAQDDNNNNNNVRSWYSTFKVNTLVKTRVVCDNV